MANPQTPQYAPNLPSKKKCSDSDGLNVIPILEGVSGGKTAEVLGGFSITSTDLSDASVDRYKVDYTPYVPVTVDLTLVVQSSGGVEAQPVLKGTEIVEINATWAYNAERNGDISTQSIVNSAAGSDPSLTAVARSADYVGLSITEDGESVQITGDDGESSDSDTKAVEFVNYLAIGLVDPTILINDNVDIQAIFDAAADKRKLRTQQNQSFTASGRATEYMVVFHPASWGESAFTKGDFTGGYVRLYYVRRVVESVEVDIFVDQILAGDVELPINIDNGNNGYTEPYYAYQSAYPARTGLIVMTKK